MLFLVLVMAAACGRDCDDCDAISDEIRKEAAERMDVPEGRQPCGPKYSPEFDLPNYAEACNQLRDCLDEAGSCADEVTSTVGGVMFLAPRDAPRTRSRGLKSACPQFDSGPRHQVC
jgi:hypothetical protein